MGDSGCYLFLFKILSMGLMRQLAEYLYIKKKDPSAPRSSWMRYMHGINRISIFMFLFGLLIILVRLIFFRRH